MRLLATAFATVVTVTALVACSSDSAPAAGDAGASTAATGCAAEARKDTYSPGMTKSVGALTVKLLRASPAPPSKGKNELTLQVLDGDKPVEGATLTVTPWMPDHGHGSGVKPTVTPASSGEYLVGDVYLPMSGLWQLKIDVQYAGNSAPVQVMFQFCLEG